jgi:hypothetical protein
MLPLRTESEANKREHWAKKAKRASEQRRAVAMAWLTKARVKFPQGNVPQLVIHLIRVAPRAMDDDNLARSFKAIRDEVAKQLGLDDRDQRLRFVYEQRRGAPREYAIEIHVGEE